MSGYGLTTQKLRDRILELIPEHPEILGINNPFDLFKIEGFDVSDLEPSLAQATVALASAKMKYREKQ